MKLANLVSYKNTLDSISQLQHERKLNNTLEQMANELGAKGLYDSDVYSNIQRSQNSIAEELANLRTCIKHELQFVQTQINEQHAEYFAKSKEIYQASLHDTAEYIFERHKKNNIFSQKEQLELFLSRLGQYTTWKKPGLQIRPLKGQITDSIKALDPLYLIDTDEQLLFYAKTLWTENYQKRLRYYTIDEHQKQMLDQLPNNQFGLIVCVEYFEYKPFSMIANFIEEFFRILCEGGVAVFSYNNCDIASGVDKVDANYQTYVPKHILLQLVKEVGFELIKDVDAGATASWVEVKKPGEITSVRGGQTLAEIRGFS